jgi:cell division protein FtsL
VKLKRSSIITRIVILSLIVYAGISLVSLKSKVAEARAAQAELQAQVSEISQANAELEYDIKHSGDQETIEDIARNKLGLVMPGEKIFFDISN